MQKTGSGVPGAKWALLAAALFGVFAQFIAAEFPDAGTLAGVLAAAIVAALGAGAKALEVFAERRKAEAETEIEGLPRPAHMGIAPGEDVPGVAPETRAGRSALGAWWNGSA